jgi:hypothetical protein
MIEAKPNTKLRRNIISAFFHKGYCGPNCNLDDVSAYVTNYDDWLSLSFWDMNCTIYKGDECYEKILNEM